MEDFTTAAVIDSEIKVCAITPCGLSTEPNAPDMPTTVNVAIKNLTRLERRMEFLGPNVANKRIEFTATNNVAPSWTDTANQSGNAPNKAGKADPRIEQIAKKIFCRKIFRVMRPSAKSSGTAEITDVDPPPEDDLVISLSVFLR